MILRRLAEAIRDQNWFTVVLEVLIVVVGIFIGLQVDDWNQLCLERENDQRVLALFVDELEEMLIDADTDLKVTTEYLQNLSEATEIALNCDATDGERTRLTTILINTQLDWRVPNIRPSGLAEISNSGMLERLGNPELSWAVGNVNQSIKFMDDSMDLIAPTYHRAFEMLLPYLVFTAPIRLDKADVGLARQPPSEYMTIASHDVICSSQEFLLGLSVLMTHCESVVYNFDQWHQALERAQQLVAGEAP